MTVQQSNSNGTNPPTSPQSRNFKRNAYLTLITVAILGFIVSAIWFWLDPGFEPLIGILTGIGLLAESVLLRKRKYSFALATIAIIVVGGGIFYLIDDVWHGTPSETKITIRVADEEGRPVPRVNTLLFHEGNAYRQTTDTNGIALFTADSSFTEARLVVETDEYQIHEETIDLSRNHTMAVNLQRTDKNNGTVVVRVIDARKSQLISGAEVIMIVAGEIYKDVTDSNGIATFMLEFSSGKINAEMSVQTDGNTISNETITLLPNQVQDIRLDPAAEEIRLTPLEVAEQSDLRQLTPTGSIRPTVQANTPTNEELIGSGVEVTQEIGAAGLRVILLDADGQPVKNTFIEVYQQQPDVSGNPSMGDRATYGTIDQQGRVEFELTSDTYVVCPSNIEGYGWTEAGCVYDLQVESGKTTTVKLQAGFLEIGIVNAKGEPLKGIYSQIYTQQEDVNGNPSTKDRVADSSTDNRGLVLYTLTPGLYIAQINLVGYNWGELQSGKGEVNMVVQPGETNRVVIELGLLQVNLRQENGQPASNVYIQVYTQQPDVNGNPTLADRIWDGSTNSGGIAEIDLTQGLYALKIGENVLYDVSIEPGKVTITDGETFTIP